MLAADHGPLIEAGCIISAMRCALGALSAALTPGAIAARGQATA